jgi:chaperonin GroEL (HSP60 family)
MQLSRSLLRRKRIVAGGGVALIRAKSVFGKIKSI